MLFRSMLIFLVLASSVQARPVSYPGGWTGMFQHDSDKHSVHIHYSPTATTSVGYLGEYWRAKDWQFHGVQVNHLVKRWNAKGSQANLYLKGTAGVAHSDFRSFDDKESLARAIEKVFGKREEVESVKVDLNEHAVNIAMKDNADIDDETLTALITDSGYNVESIERHF